MRELSVAQQKRRNRILSAARQLLSKRGYDGVTMRDLARKSGVTLKTLYDVYGSKDSLLIESVKDRVALIFRIAEGKAAGRTGLNRILFFVESGVRATMATKTLSRAIAPFLAGPTDRLELEEIYARCHGSGLMQIAAAGELLPWVGIPAALDLLLLSNKAVIQLWAKDRIKSKHLLSYSLTATAEVLAPLVTGETRRDIIAMIRREYEDVYNRDQIEAAPPARLAKADKRPARERRNLKELDVPEISEAAADRLVDA